MNRIKQLREELGMTQPELGKVLNVQGAAMSKYENEKIPLTSDTIKTLAEFFGVSTDYLLCKTDDKEESEQSEPEYTTYKERELLNFYRTYSVTDTNFESTIQGFFPTIGIYELSPNEKKILNAYRELSEDNQDIIIGKMKELLREQRLSNDNDLKKASGK